MADYENSRRLTAHLRDIPPEEVLKAFGCELDPRDRHQWRTPRGPVSIKGEKFWFWHHARGGGGAIDLAMVLLGEEFSTARQWLVSHFPRFAMEDRSSLPFTLPKRHDDALPRVVDYLTTNRGLPENLLFDLIHNEKIFADRYANCVFVLLGKKELPVGAELRSTSQTTWRGMSPGSKKSRGFFHVGDPTVGLCVLCESAIDAISCYALGISPLCISISGATPLPICLPILLRRGFKVWCGYDNDEVGNKFAEQMIKVYPEVRRRPPRNKDWNDDLLQG